MFLEAAKSILLVVSALFPIVDPIGGAPVFLSRVLSILAAGIGSAIVAATIYLCYAFADRLATVLGPTGTNVIVKLTSFLLVCIGVQIIWNGVSQLLRTLPH